MLLKHVMSRGVDWIYLVQENIHWQDVVNIAVSIQFLKL
jgi:hypothetical protein